MNDLLQIFPLIAVVLFCTGLAIVLIKRSAIFVLMGIELMINAAHLNFAFFGKQWASLDGQIFGIFSIVLTAGEVSIALAILLLLNRQTKSSDLEDFSDLEH